MVSAAEKVVNAKMAFMPTPQAMSELVFNVEDVLKVVCVCGKMSRQMIAALLRM
jgi:hypothetical protein